MNLPRTRLGYVHLPQLFGAILGGRPARYRRKHAWCRLLQSAGASEAERVGALEEAVLAAEEEDLHLKPDGTEYRWFRALRVALAEYNPEYEE